MSTDSDAMTWRLDALASNIPGLLANDSVPVRFGDKYGWIALPRELAVQIVADHKAAAAARESQLPSMSALAGAIADARAETMAAKTAAREALEALRDILFEANNKHVHEVHSSNPRQDVQAFCIKVRDIAANALEVLEKQP